MGKARRRTRGTRPAGVDVNEQRRQRLEARRQAKAEALAAARRKQRRARVVRALALVALAGVAVWFFVLRNLGPTAINGHPVSEFSAAGVMEHTNQTVTYETTPPVSGQHAPSPAACGVHDAPIPNEVQVHNLEHGAVGVQYRPDLDPQQIKEIEALVNSYDSHVFSAPYPDMDTPVAVTSWAHMMTLDTFEEDTVRQYIDEFRQKGPEKNDCDNTADDPFEPEPSPSPSPTRGGKGSDATASPAES